MFQITDDKNLIIIQYLAVLFLSYPVLWFIIIYSQDCGLLFSVYTDLQVKVVEVVLSIVGIVSRAAVVSESNFDLQFHFGAYMTTLTIRPIVLKTVQTVIMPKCSKHYHNVVMSDVSQILNYKSKCTGREREFIYHNTAKHNNKPMVIKIGLPEGYTPITAGRPL